MDIGCDYPSTLAYRCTRYTLCTFMSSVKHPVIFHEIRKVSKKMQQFASVQRKKSDHRHFVSYLFFAILYILLVGNWILFWTHFRGQQQNDLSALSLRAELIVKGATTCSRIACGHINGNNRHWFWMRRGQLPLLDIRLHGAGKYLSGSAAAPPWYRVYRVLVRAVNGLARNLTVPGPQTSPPYI